MLIDASITASSSLRRSAAEAGVWKDVAADCVVVLEKTAHDDWKVRHDAFEDLQAHARAVAQSVRRGDAGGSSLVPPECLGEAVEAGMRDQHGAVTKAASGAVVEAAAALRAAVEASREVARPVQAVAMVMLQSAILALGANKGKVMAAYAFEAAKAVATTVPSAKLLPLCAAPLGSGWKGASSGVFREACLGLVLAIIIQRDHLAIAIIVNIPTQLLVHIAPRICAKLFSLIKMAKGLYANIHAKRKRIKAGSGERMRKAGSAGAPTAKGFKEAAKTAKKTPKKTAKKTAKKRK